jgi:hypothetical protein
MFRWQLADKTQWCASSKGEIPLQTQDAEAKRVLDQLTSYQKAIPSSLAAASAIATVQRSASPRA